MSQRSRAPRTSSGQRHDSLANDNAVSRRQFILASGAATLTGALASCTDKGPTQPRNSDLRVTIFKNPGDPTIATIRRNDGRIATYFGVKDSSGRPLSIRQTQLAGNTSNPNDVVTIRYDAGGNPTVVTLGSGGHASFEYPSATRVVVTMTSPDGVTSVRRTYDKNKSPAKSLYTQQRTRIAPENIPPFDPHRWRAEQAIFESKAERQRLASQGTALDTASRRFTVRVGCGADVVAGATLSGSVRVGESGDSRPLAFDELSPGVFTTQVPTRSAGSVNTTEICEALDTIIDVGCQTAKSLGIPGVSYLCASLSLIPGGAPVAPICEAIAIGIVEACEFIPDGAGVLLPCGAIQNTVDFFTTETVRVSLTAKHPILGTQSALLVENGISNIPDETRLALTSKPTISALVTDPADPTPAQDYRIIATSQCTPANSVLVLTIRGTDGYSNSSSTTITGSTQVASLFVPGGSAGIVDTITAELRVASTILDSRATYVAF